MIETSQNSVILPLAGATTGAGISATIGGVGLVGSFGGIGLGMGAMTGIGALTGAAVYGGITAISEGDITAIAAVSLGVAGGVGVSVSIGGVGVGFAGTAVGIGMGTMAVAGGIVGLGIYGIAKIVDQGVPNETFAQTYDRIDNYVSHLEAYNQAMWEVDPMLAELAWKQKFAQIEIEEELEQLKWELKAKNKLKSESSNFQQPKIEEKEVKSKPNININSKWQLIRILSGHTASINDLAVTSDSKILASASSDRTISLCNITTSKQIYTFFWTNSRNSGFSH